MKIANDLWCVHRQNESTIKPSQFFLKNQKITTNEMMREKKKTQISKLKMSFTFVFSNISFSSVKVSS
jgi:hypothetical protein